MDFLNSLVNQVGPAGCSALTLAGLAAWKAAVFLFSPRKAVKEDTAPSYASVGFWACVWALSWLALPAVIPYRWMAGRNVWGELPPVPVPEPLGDDALALIEDIETSPVAKIDASPSKRLTFGNVSVDLTGIPHVSEGNKQVTDDYTPAEQEAIGIAAKARAKQIEDSERANRRAARVGAKRTPSKSCDCGAGCKGGCDCGCDPKKR